MRPFGVSILYASYDEQLGFQLFNSDPSGNYSAYLAKAIGANNATSTTVLKENYQEGLSLDQAFQLAAKVICKSLDTMQPDPERLELTALTKTAKGLELKTLTNEEISAVLKDVAASMETEAAS
jgi:20S proteasome subunit alpha 3